MINAYIGLLTIHHKQVSTLSPCIELIFTLKLMDSVYIKSPLASYFLSRRYSAQRWLPLCLTRSHSQWEANTYLVTGWLVGWHTQCLVWFIAFNSNRELHICLVHELNPHNILPNLRRKLNRIFTLILLTFIMFALSYLPLILHFESFPTALIEMFRLFILKSAIIVPIAS